MAVVGDGDSIVTGTLNADGTFTPGRPMCNSWIRKCPYFIMVPEHYRDDGSCRCDDPDAPMAEWGYTWDAEAGRWA